MIFKKEITQKKFQKVLIEQYVIIIDLTSFFALEALAFLYIGLCAIDISVTQEINESNS